MQNIFSALDMQLEVHFYLCVLKPRVVFFALCKTADDNLIMSNDN